MNAINLRLPFFAYGLLQPGQPAFFQIRDYVAMCETARAPGELLVRDGLPILKRSDKKTTKGVLMTFKDDSTAEAYKTIRAFEPRSIYQPETEIVAGRRAYVLYAKHPEAGNPLDYPDWNGWDDPLLTYALDVVEKTQRQASQKHSYDRLFQLQMAYLLLWTAIERYVIFRYPATLKIDEGIRQLPTEPAFAGLVKDHVPKAAAGQAPGVVDSRNPGGKVLRLDPSDPSQCLEFYRRVRHNATHRGKSGPGRDAELLDESLTQLVPIFRGVVKAARMESESDRSRVLTPRN